MSYKISNSIRSHLRHCYLTIMGHALAQNTTMPRTQFFHSHGLRLEDEKDFLEKITIIKDIFTFMSFYDAFKTVLTDISKPIAALSFDDGKKSSTRIGEILSDQEISACFFVCPGLVGTDGYMSWIDIKKLVELGHEIGGHTMNHPDLGKQKQSVIHDEIYDCRRELLERGIVANHFAWPFGRFENFNEYSRQIVFESGFISCASGVRGCHSVTHETGHDQLCLRRDQFEAHWPDSHMKYFIYRSAHRASITDNHFPYGS